MKQRGKKLRRNPRRTYKETESMSRFFPKKE
jgi:hypothetical protein